MGYLFDIQYLLSDRNFVVCANGKVTPFMGPNACDCILDMLPVLIDFLNPEFGEYYRVTEKQQVYVHLGI